MEKTWGHGSDANGYSSSLLWLPWSIYTKIEQIYENIEQGYENWQAEDWRTGQEVVEGGRN